MKNSMRQLRENRKLSQESLAKSVGVSRYTIISIEKGSHNPSGELMLRIAEFFRRDPREIFFIDDVNSVQHENSTA